MVQGCGGFDEGEEGRWVSGVRHAVFVVVEFAEVILVRILEDDSLDALGSFMLN